MAARRSVNDLMIAGTVVLSELASFMIDDRLPAIPSTFPSSWFCAIVSASLRNELILANMGQMGMTSWLNSAE